MSMTSTANAIAGRQAAATAVTGTCPASLVRAVRAEVRRGLDWQQTADCIARALRGCLPGPAAILPAPLRRGAPAVVGRLEAGRLLLDLRSVPPEQDEPLVAAILAAAQRLSP